MGDLSMQTIIPEQLNQDSFKPYGEVIELSGVEPITINGGNCQRYSDLASLDICSSGRAGISLFDAKAYSNPLTLTYVERHPLGSQAFLPTSNDPYLVVVARDQQDIPQTPKAFITNGYQGVNYHRNTWHGVLTPIVQQSLFVVIDYIGSKDNLEEYEFSTPYLIEIASLINPTS